MTRFRVFLISGLVAVAGLAAAAPSASAAANDDHASCLGSLSSFVGPLQLRDDFAPQPGERVSFGARAHEDLAICIAGALG